MPVFSYLTIQAPAQGIYKEKGSKFLSFAYPVKTEEDIKEKLLALRKEYFDARHHCYAWILGPEKKLFRASDDGEPNHSAGDPILGQIRSKNLTDVLIVVVRYFGGVKLGVGRLVTAYKTAAEDAIASAIIIENQVTVQLNIQYSYEATPDVMRLVKEFDLTIMNQEYNNECLLSFTINLSNKEPFLDKVKLMRAMGTNVQVLTID
ncbi:IMPACT family protein [Chryseosolibacter indicus]|uniref:IMPACT family protein n=1 Tax=Chryseosolibacter indicus TaxID=2782351 RepID=A0ABS5VQ46_9BACT|nr:YigZ family protein [Chryseosolibacter indicus]MBT1702136.1 IMPACT family protein [Chryseosolibacter indicus]